MPGESIASPSAHSITAGPAVDAATGPSITATVTMASAVPPPKLSTATSTRNQLSQRRCSDASASASVGRVSAARRAATNAATPVLSSPAPAATIIGTQPWWNSITPGTTSCVASCR